MVKSTQGLVGAQAAANALGIHVDTLRKRAKKGLVAATRIGSKWYFDLTVLTGSKPAPFVPGITRTKRNVTDVIFVLDRSGSMGGLYESAKRNLDNYVAELVKASDANNKYFVSIVNFDDTINVSLRGSGLTGLQASRYYLQPNGWTKLYDAIDTAISICKDRDDGERAFLVYVLTDGMENRSSTTAGSLSARVAALTATDRYTFAAAGPAGFTGHMSKVGFLPGNLTEWEQTLQGSNFLGGQTVSAFNSYAATRSAGITSSTSFYANATGPAASFAAKLDDKLDDITSSITVERVTDKDPVVIKNFCEKKFGSFPKGKIAYQLTESEKVQDYKAIVIQDTAKGKFYSGWAAAKKLLGIPDFTGTVRIKPGNLGEFKVFVQSTSINRKLVPGTAVVKLP